MGADVRSKIERRCASPRRELGPYLVWSAVLRFAVGLFAGIDRTAIAARSLSLNELRQMLIRFEVLDHKRRGRCWSPTAYTDGATSRGNAGVEAVSVLVFDLDRVPADPE